jgi:hypothetical protein
MMSLKSKSARRAVVAVTGAGAVMAGLTVAADPALAYAPGCTGFPTSVSRGETYQATCSNFPAKKAMSLYERQLNGTGKNAKSATYILGRSHTGHLGNANTGFYVNRHLHLGSETIHVASGGKVFVFNVVVHRASS